jgi:hypothetical protein
MGTVLLAFITLLSESGAKAFASISVLGRLEK